MSVPSEQKNATRIRVAFLVSDGAVRYGSRARSC